jgi:hypothetical protein
MGCLPTLGAPPSARWGDWSSTKLVPRHHRREGAAPTPALATALGSMSRLPALVTTLGAMGRLPAVVTSLGAMGRLPAVVTSLGAMGRLPAVGAPPSARWGDWSSTKLVPRHHRREGAAPTSHHTTPAPTTFSGLLQGLVTFFAGARLRSATGLTGELAGAVVAGKADNWPSVRVSSWNRPLLSHNQMSV